MDTTGRKRARVRWTYAEFARLPESGSTRYEIIDDELVVTPAPALRHQRIATDLVTALNGFVRSHDLGQVYAGPVDVIFAEGDYLEPDIVFVRKEHAHLLSDRGVEGPPDLVVEVTSPSTATRDRGIKLDRYRLYGVPEYWIVDLDARTVEVWPLAHAPDEPTVLGPGDTLRWTPDEGGPALELTVGEVLPEP
ncbi:MAG: Uma2 family endonuclease [Gemmatimonadota bacterium]|jgi:Uma2 family endonuclease